MAAVWSRLSPFSYEDMDPGAEGTSRNGPEQHGTRASTWLNLPPNQFPGLFEDSQDEVARRLRRPQLFAQANDAFEYGREYDPHVSERRIVITHQRMSSRRRHRRWECVVCREMKTIDEFPRSPVTRLCAHPPNVCLECLEMSIRADFETKMWNEIRCPECREYLEYGDIRRYADAETWERYNNLSLHHGPSTAEIFTRCPSCGHGQVHRGGTLDPLVTCHRCGRRSCFRHGNMDWHEGLTCEQYDAYLADPADFRRRAAELARLEEEGRQTVLRTGKPCPGCGIAIEKNGGCNHIRCTRCRYDFCFACLSPWDPGSCNWCEDTVWDRSGWYHCGGN